MLLHLAIGSETAYEKYSPACVSLLCSSQNARPSAFPRFLEQTVFRAANDLSSDTLRPVHQLTATTGAGCSGCLPKELLREIQEKCLDLLNTFSSGDPLAYLLCLAVLANLSLSDGCSKPGDVIQEYSHVAPRDRQTQSMGSSMDWFVSKRAQKTLSVVVLNAVSIVSDSSITPMTKETAVEALKLCTEISARIDLPERRSWIAGNGQKVRKFVDKIGRLDCDDERVTEAINLLCKLSGDQQLPSDAINIVEKLVQSRCLYALKRHSLRQLLPLMKTTTITRIVMAMLTTACLEIDQPREIDRIYEALHMLEALKDYVEGDSSRFRVILPSSADEESMRRLAHLASRSPSTAARCPTTKETDTCAFTFMHTQNVLQQELRLLFVKCSIHCAPQDGEQYSTMLSELLDGVSSVGGTPTNCKHYDSGWHQHRSRSTTSIAEVQSTPEAFSISCGWRESLANKLTSDANSRCYQITRIVGDVCRDLEARCDNVERPLKEERAVSLQLRQQLEKSESLGKTLEQRYQDSKAAYAMLESKYEGLLQQCRSSEVRSGQLCNEIEDKNKELEFYKLDVNASRDEEAERARLHINRLTDSIEVKELTIAGQRDDLQASAIRERDLLNETNQLKTNVSDGDRKLLEADAALRKMVETQSATEDVLRSLETKMHSLQDSLTTLRRENDEAVAFHQQARMESAKTVTELKSQLESAKLETVQVKRTYEDFKNVVEAERNGFASSYEKTIAELRNGICQADTRTLAKSQAYVKEIAGLECDLERVREDLEQKSKKAARIDEMRDQFLSILNQHHYQDHPPSFQSKPARQHDSSPSATLSTGDTSSPARKRSKKDHCMTSNKSGRRPKMGQTKHILRPWDNNRKPLEEVLNVPNRRLTPASPLEVIEKASTTDSRWASPDKQDFFEGNDLFTSNDERLLFPPSADQGTIDGEETTMGL